MLEVIMGSYKTEMSPEKIWIRLLILNCYIFKQNPFPGLIILPTRHWCVRQWADEAVFVFMAVTHSHHYCCCVSQVHKEYSKCLRHSYCCSRTSTSSSHGSLKNSGLRTNNRYYSSSQTRHAAAHRQVRHSANLSFQIPTQTHPFSKQLILQDILIYTYIYALCTFYVVFPPAALHWFYSAFVKRPCASQKALKNEMFYYCQITLVQNKHFPSERTCSFQPNIFFNLQIDWNILPVLIERVKWSHVLWPCSVSAVNLQYPTTTITTTITTTLLFTSIFYD